MIRDDAPKFVPGKSFDDWFHKNEELIKEMYRNDAYELLYNAWFAGFDYGLDAMTYPLMKVCGVIPLDKKADET